MNSFQQEAELARLRATGGGAAGASSSQTPGSSSTELEQRLAEALARAQAREEELAQLVGSQPLFAGFGHFWLTFLLLMTIFFHCTARGDEPGSGPNPGLREPAPGTRGRASGQRHPDRHPHSAAEREIG